MKRYVLFFSLIVFSVMVYGQYKEEAKGRGLSFIPDYQFKGSDLNDWQAWGDVAWSSMEGEIVGFSSADASYGLLCFGRSFQDVATNTLVKFTGEVEVGVVLRLASTGEGSEGILVTLTKGKADVWQVRFDKNMKEIVRTRLRIGGGMSRLALPYDSKAVDPEQHLLYKTTDTTGKQLDPPLPMTYPNTKSESGVWNQLEVILDLNILRSYVNDGAGPRGAVDDEFSKFGAIGLYLTGKGEVRFKDFACKDLAVRYLPKEQTASRFEVQQISDMYYSWGAAAADFNNDGTLDIVSGPHIFYGPDYTTFVEIYPGFTFNPSFQFAEVNCQYAYDFNVDGWTDIFVGPPYSKLYLNPKGESRRWDAYTVISGRIASETTIFVDLDTDGIPEFIYGTNDDGGTIKYAKFDPSNPTQAWEIYTISAPGYFVPHGIGVGDINGDGRKDILNVNGWWEQPGSSPSTGSWTFHPIAFGRYGHRTNDLIGGCMMAIYDVNGDGKNDVVTSLNAHGFGLAWYEQKTDRQGNMMFECHMVMGDYSTENAGNVTFSQLHAAACADIDGDGILDYVVGKRFWSHLDTYLDPDPHSAPVLYWYRTVRDPDAPGGARLVPELVHNRSGVGSDILIADLDQDGNVEIVTATNRGTFVFWNKGEAYEE